MSRERGAMLYDILRQVRPLVLNSARVVEASLKPHGLTVGMRAVLEILHDSGATTVPAIARHLDLPRQGVQRHVNDLGARGYVEARPNAAHRRSVLIALTPSGGEVIQQVTDAELRQLATLALDCTDDELRTAVKVLASLSRDVRRRAAALNDRRAGER
jgi:DNA-binding MarR family transcriptional regulator